MEVNFTEEDIQDTAKNFLSLIPGYTVIAFHGEMGAGKTTFIHALCEAMGVTDPVTSPTFSIINEYKTGTGKRVYHIDLYRLKDAEEAISAGVEDCLFSGDTCLVEWPEIAASIFPAETLHVHISVINGHTRRITLNMP